MLDDTPTPENGPDAARVGDPAAGPIHGDPAAASDHDDPATARVDTGSWSADPRLVAGRAVDRGERAVTGARVGELGPLEAVRQARDPIRALPAALTDGPAASCDLLVDLVASLHQIDELTAHVSQLLERAHHTGEVEAATGVSIELWLSAAGRRTRADRRMLQAWADLRPSMPTLARAFDGGAVSWAQVRALTLACQRLPGHLRAAVDHALAPEIEALATAEPDDLVAVVSRLLGSLQAEADEVARAEQAATRDRFVNIQPRLDGSGGQLFAELDALGLAIVSEALDAGTPPSPFDARRDDAEDADGDADGVVGSGHQLDERHLGAPRDAAARWALARTLGARRADRLVSLCARALAQGTAAAPAVVAPTVLLTMSLDNLLDGTGPPPELLTRLTGGRLKVSTPTAQRLVEQAGARLRGIVLDDTGQILGVGRSTRVPPGWLREAITVRDGVCREPGCQTSAVVCDVDHAQPWHPHADREAGATDIENLAALCRSANIRKERQGWYVYGLPDGRRRHHHERSGLTVDTAPRTRRLRLAEDARAGPDPDPG